MLCGFALLFPGHLLRRGLDALQLTESKRLLTMQIYLAVSTATIIATLAGGLGWWAPLSILVSGNALWALELEERSRETVGG